MKELQEIVDLLHNKQLDHIEIFDKRGLRQSNNKFGAFFRAMQDRLFPSDKEAAAALYDALPSDDRYRKLKSRFRRKLLNTLFFIDVRQPQSEGYKAAWYYSNRHMALVHILKWVGAKQNAIREALQVQQVALKYKFAEMLVSSALSLRALYAESGDEKSYKVQNRLFYRYAPIQVAEHRAEEIVQRIRFAFYLDGAPSKSVMAETSAWCDELLSNSEKYDSPLISLNAFEAWMRRFEIEGRFLEADEVCEQAMQYLKNHPRWASFEREIVFAMGRLRAALHNKDFKSGRAVAEKAFPLLPYGTAQRLELMELYLLLSIHAESMLNAFAIYQDVLEHKALPKASENQKEKWDIFSAYMHLLMELRPSSQQFVLSQKKKIFRVKEFMEAPIPFLPQKENQTILIAIAQVMFLFHFRNLSAASRYIEWLYKLSGTLVRKDTLRRQATFIKLLYQLHLSEYNPAAMKKTEALLRDLGQRPFRYRGQMHNLEVIPYEKLWEMVLGFFK